MLNFTVDEAQRRAKEHLAAFPPKLTADYLAYAEHGSERLLDKVLLGVVQFYHPLPSSLSTNHVPNDARLREDLGCDSLTLIEVAFLVESLFDAKIPDDALAKLVTVGDLRRHFQSSTGA